MILDVRDFEDNGRESQEFLVKWIGKAHIYDSWLSERRLKVHNSVKLNNFLSRSEEDIQQDLNFLPHWQEPERIVDSRK
jgi:chromodomain-helicase-DNA-binding protein 4